MRIPHKFHQRLLFGLLLALGANSGALAQANSSSAAHTITLEESLQAASTNLDAQIAAQQLASARADIASANHASTPTLSTGVSQIDLQNGVGAGSWLTQKRVDKSIGIDWTWERGDKRLLRTRAATETANAFAQDLIGAQVQQKLLASNAFFDLLGAQSAAQQISAMTDSAKQLADIASKRLAAGDLSAQDATRSAIESQRAQNDLALAQQNLAQAALKLGLIVGLHNPTLVALASPSAPAANTPAAPALTDEGLTTLCDKHPDVQAAQTRTLAAKAQLDGALALQKNDITLGTAFDNFPGTSTRLLTFKMQIPLQLGALGGYTYQGEIAKAESQLIIAEATLERARQTTRSEILQLHQNLTSSQQRAANYAGNIAQAAKQVADQAELAYNKGALSLTDLLEARRTWRLTALETIAAQTDFDKARTAWDLRFKAVP